MSLAFPASLEDCRTLADLLDRLGAIAPGRVRLHPLPGTASEQDVISAASQEDVLCELVDGVLVEKPMGYLESLLAAELMFFLRSYLQQNDLGVVAGEGGMMRLWPGRVRIPDVSFVAWDRLPGRLVPREPIPDLVPDLAVEVRSPSNTAQELDQKVDDYFKAGVRLVWIIDPATRSARVYTSPRDVAALAEHQSLDGGAVLPGFLLPLQQLFERADCR